MKNIGICILLVALFCRIDGIYSSDSKEQLKSTADKEPSAFSKAAQKAIAKMKRRLAKVKKKYDNKLDKLITKNVSKTDREKNKELIKLKAEIDRLNNELHYLV